MVTSTRAYALRVNFLTHAYFLCGIFMSVIMHSQILARILRVDSRVKRVFQTWFLCSHKCCIFKFRWEVKVLCGKFYVERGVYACGGVTVNPFNPKLIMQILPTILIQEENDWVMLREMIVQSTLTWANYISPNSPYCMIYLWWGTEREYWSWSLSHEGKTHLAHLSDILHLSRPKSSQ